MRMIGGSEPGRAPGLTRAQARGRIQKVGNEEMENSLSVILSRQSVLGRQMDTIATNLANTSTAGFKAEKLLYKEVPERTTRNGERLSLVHDVTYLRDMSEGQMSKTDNTFDLAISGNGFFVVNTIQGERYTRHGAFSLDNQGQLVTLTGAPVLGEGNAPILVPPGTVNVTITADGTISADSQQIGKVQVVEFDQPSALVKEGDSLYRAQDQAPRPAAESRVQQGMIEGSNVKSVAEMTRMIEVARSYQSAARMAEAEHERIRNAINIIVGKN
jgi:flagellar basal-body rod protein FlgF